MAISCVLLSCRSIRIGFDRIRYFLPTHSYQVPGLLIEGHHIGQGKLKQVEATTTKRAVVRGRASRFFRTASVLKKRNVPY